MANFNPRAPYGARQVVLTPNNPLGTISIHAPHTGRDLWRLVIPQRFLHFNPRAPYGARLDPVTDESNYEYISIHAPHTGRDTAPDASIVTREQFQSTRPIRGATP